MSVDLRRNLDAGRFFLWRLPNIKGTPIPHRLQLDDRDDGRERGGSVESALFPTATTPATADWSSTALRGGGNTAPSSAWLLELGEQRGARRQRPRRNAQGLVSYEVMTSSYRVFAVRGPVATTVEQGTSGTARLVNIAARVAVGGTAGTPIRDSCSVVPAPRRCSCGLWARR